MTAGYTAHVWELYGMRAWTAPFLAFLLVRLGHDTTAAAAQAALISSVMVLLGTAGTMLSGTRVRSLWPYRLRGCYPEPSARPALWRLGGW